MKLATLINIHIAMNSLMTNATTVERALEAPPTYQDIQNEPDSDIVEIHSPEVINAAESLVAICDPPVTSGGQPLSLPEKKIIDHYLPEELSSLTLEDDHGVSIKEPLFTCLSMFPASSDVTTSRKSSCVAALD
jgi:hypothetical protein